VVQTFALISSLCNDSSIEFSIERKRFERFGPPTEAAIRVFTEKIGKVDQNFSCIEAQLSPMQYNHHLTADYEKIAALEFTRDRKSMSTLHRRKGGGTNSLFVKGAPESIVTR
jgi:magnesium-transporting ATPase (P-type)